jgi:NADPH:quinone reductase-like Zn-dependent oxidoreductase
MQVLQYANYGKPDDVLRLADIEVEKPGDGQIGVQVLAVPIHLKDLYFMQGLPGFRMPLPAVPGNQAFGRITYRGSDLSCFEAGDFVHVLHLEPWKYPLSEGTWRAETIVPVSSVFLSPCLGDPMQMGLVSSSLISASLLLREALKFGRAGWLIQNAANSSCGRFLIQLARAEGIRTINVVRRDDVRDELYDIGADVVVQDHGGLPDEIAKTLKDAEVTVALDAVGGASAATLARCLGPGGVIISYGMASGRPAEIGQDLMIFRGICHRGFLMDRSIKELRPDERSELFRKLSTAVGEKNLVGKIAQAYSLGDFERAIKHAQMTSRSGKVMLLPNG